MKIIRRNIDKSNELPNLNSDPILNKIFYTRGVRSKEELNYAIENLLPANFKEIDKATTIVADAIVQRKKIRIVGDYDTDGAASTALIMRFFDDIKYYNADYYIPKRFEDGYGINENIVKQAFRNKVELIITVDNGITAFVAANLAKELGIELIITDHHLPLESLPIASAIVNPQQKNCDFASKCIAGCGVAFYLVANVIKELALRNYFSDCRINYPHISSYLDLVALGTIADVVPLDYNNRILVQLGIDLIRNKQTSKGVMELIKISGQVAKNLTSQDICFGIGPRLNAAGRLEDMSFGVNCLLENNSQFALRTAEFLEYCNNSRKTIEQNMRNCAYYLIDRDYSNTICYGLVLFDLSFHMGISGVLASKLAEEINTPVIIFAKKANSDILVGSARSVGDFHIKEILECINNQLPLTTFGGHAKAGGVTIKESQFNDFRFLFANYVHNHFQGVFPEKTFFTDGPLSENYFCSGFVRSLVFDHPWGTDFPLPMFDGEFFILRQVLVKDLHMRVLLAHASGAEFWGMYFFYDKSIWPNNLIKKVKVVYSFNCNSNRDNAVYNLVIRAMEPTN
jgi:single-stranded-DNA-specific exonuclease